MSCFFSPTLLHLIVCILWLLDFLVVLNMHCHYFSQTEAVKDGSLSLLQSVWSNVHWHGIINTRALGDWGCVDHVSGRNSWPASNGMALIIELMSRSTIVFAHFSFQLADSVPLCWMAPLAILPTYFPFAAFTSDGATEPLQSLFIYRQYFVISTLCHQRFVEERKCNRNIKCACDFAFVVQTPNSVRCSEIVQKCMDLSYLAYPVLHVLLRAWPFKVDSTELRSWWSYAKKKKSNPNICPAFLYEN